MIILPCIEFLVNIPCYVSFTFVLAVIAGWFSKVVHI